MLLVRLAVVWERPVDRHAGGPLDQHVVHSRQHWLELVAQTAQDGRIESERKQT